MAFKFQLRIPVPPALTWKCSWCHFTNIRHNAGLDHCSACNAETLTVPGMDNTLAIRYTRAGWGRSYA